MRFRTGGVALLLALAVAGCASSAGSEAAPPADAPRTERPTTTVTSVPTTTTVPPTTSTSTTVPTTTTAVAPRLPGAATSGRVLALTAPSGVVVPVVGGSVGAWQVLTPCGVRTTLTAGTPIHGATVVVDPGHGGIETGAEGANGLVEKDLNLQVARLVATALEREGADVVLTRTADYRVTLDARAALAHALKPPVFVSIHHNGGADGPADRPGTEVYYQHASAASKRLAGLLHEEVLAAFAGRPGVQWYGNVDAGAKYRLGSTGNDYYGILRGTQGVTAALSEALFLSASPSEAQLLARPEVQAAEAEAITRAIRRFMLGDEPGSGYVEPIPRTTPAGPGGGSAGCTDPLLT